MTRTLTLDLPRRALERALRVHVREGRDAGLVVTGEHAIVRAGRAPSMDVRLNDPAVSHVHAELTGLDGGVHVHDLTSQNGTWLGDVRLLRAIVPYGASLRAGATVFTVEPTEIALPRRSRSTSFGALVGSSPAIRDLYGALERLSRAPINVLFSGRPGTGKRTAALALHAARGGEPIVEIDAARLPAAGLTIPAQAPILLLHLEAIAVERQAEIAAALEGRQVLATTSALPSALVETGALRSELFDAVAAVHVALPALDEREGDLPVLVDYFLSTLARDEAARAVSPGVLARLAQSPFPGGVRELRTTITRLALLAEGPTIELDDLAFEHGLRGARLEGLPDFKEAKRTLVDAFEREYLEKLLRRAGANVSRAAALAGIERQTLRDLLKKHGLRAT